MTCFIRPLPRDTRCTEPWQTNVRLNPTCALLTTVLETASDAGGKGESEKKGQMEPLEFFVLL